MVEPLLIDNMALTVPCAPPAAPSSSDPDEDEGLLLQRVRRLLACLAPLCALNSVLCAAAGFRINAALYGLVGLIFLVLTSLIYRGRLRSHLRAVTNAALLLASLIVFFLSLRDGPSRTTTLIYLTVLPAVSAHMLGRRASITWFAVTSALMLLAHALERLLPLSDAPLAYIIGNAISSVLLNGALSYFASAGRRIADQRIGQISAARGELLRTHQALEQTSRAMGEILDNVLTGFFVIDAQLVVQAQASRSCADLFQVTPVSGRPLLTLLPELSAGEREDLELQLAQVFMDILPSEVALAQVPKLFRRGERTLHLEGREIRDPAGAVTGVLFTVTDHTDLMASQLERDHHRLLVELMRQRDAFRAFLSEADAQLIGAAEAAAQGDQGACRNLLHTLKGNAGAYGLMELMELIHRTESAHRIDAAQVQGVRAALEGFLESNFAVLGLRLRDAEGEASAHTVTQEQLAALNRLVARAAPQALAPLRAWTQQVTARPARMLLGPIGDLVRRIAERQGKLIELRVQGEDTPLDVRRFAPVFQALPHLLRNAIDHGLEVPAERGAKPAVCSLGVDISADAGGYRIEIRDDGRGINQERLVQRAVERGLYTAQQAERLSQEQRLALIFRAGLSTADEVTDLSGRGVGMGAVLAAVQALGGTVQVRSTAGQGTSVVLHLPRPPDEAEPLAAPAQATSPRPSARTRSGYPG